LQSISFSRLGMKYGSLPPPFGAFGCSAQHCPDPPPRRWASRCPQGDPARAPFSWSFCTASSQACAFFAFVSGGIVASFLLFSCSATGNFRCPAHFFPRLPPFGFRWSPPITCFPDGVFSMGFPLTDPLFFSVPPWHFDQRDSHLSPS